MKICRWVRRFEMVRCGARSDQATGLVSRMIVSREDEGAAEVSSKQKCNSQNILHVSLTVCDLEMTICRVDGVHVEGL